MITSRALFPILASAALASLGCSSTKTASTDGGASASWTTVYGTVISSCTDHHSGGASAAGNLDLGTQSNAYANLVGVVASGPNCGVGDFEGGAVELRVKSGDAAASLLYQKLVGTQPCGAQMPSQGMPLPAAQIALVKTWIDEGAPND